jgi:hypothetical protein
MCCSMGQTRPYHTGGTGGNMTDLEREGRPLNWAPSAHAVAGGTYYGIDEMGTF